MNQTIDPKRFGLHPSTKLAETEKNHFIILIDRKSRIIMKDGKKILEKVSKIKASVPDALVTVSTTAPVCSKTKQFLEEHNVSIEYS